MSFTAEQWLAKEKKEHLEYYETNKKAKRAIEPSSKSFISQEEYEKALSMRIKVCDKECHPDDCRLMEYTEVNFYRDKKGVLAQCRICKTTTQKNKRKQEHEENLVVYNTAEEWFTSTANDTTKDGESIGFCREPREEEFICKEEYDKATKLREERQKQAHSAYNARVESRQKYKRHVDKQTEEGRAKLKKRDNDNRINSSRSHTKRRKLQYNLSKQKEDEIKNATKCFYCDGDNDGNSFGADRMNNPIAYEDDDVVPCCKYCNRMKGCLRYNEFMEACKNIYEFQTLGKKTERFVNWRVDYRKPWEESNKRGEKYICNGKEYCFKSKLHSCAHRKYSDYKYDAEKSRNLTFELTKAKFIQMRESPCTFCGYDLQDVGIDRIDNSKGYSDDNCQPCCTTCNFMKFDQSNDEFLGNVKKIVEKVDLLKKN
jgi:hypothetical protein